VQCEGRRGGVAKGERAAGEALNEATQARAVGEGGQGLVLVLVPGRRWCYRSRCRCCALIASKEHQGHPAPQRLRGTWRRHTERERERRRQKKPLHIGKEERPII
jgi:hypothetical protein